MKVLNFGVAGDDEVFIADGVKMFGNRLAAITYEFWLHSELNL